MTNEGGLYNGGTIFKINSAFNSISVLANFNTSMGVNAGGKLLMDAAGNLYGVTEFGGQFNHGTVFELPAGSGTIVPLASFPNGGDNNTSLIEDPLGNLFGVSSSGGANGLGEIYELPAGSNTIVPVYTFTSTASGNGPIGDLYVDASGNFYGTADGGPNSDGLVFELTNTGYGVAVPEPRGMLVAGTALLVLLGRRYRPAKAHCDAARM